MFRPSVPAVFLACAAMFTLDARDASAAFQCAQPTVANYSEEDKEAIFAINRKISEIRKKKGAAYLGPQDGVMCDTPDGKGKFWHFRNGSVYWSPDTGAFSVIGLIRGQWAAQGWERGPLGYPMTDEIDTYDGLAKVSKFQGGQLIWRPWTNQVTRMNIDDLQVDLPTPPGEAWVVIQANGIALDDPATPGNEADSHHGPWAYCYDLGALDGSKTKGANFVSTAYARIVLAQDQFANTDTNNSNVVVQWLGLGRYASSLHIQNKSYSNTFGSGKPAISETTPWKQRPVAASGDTIALVGKTGTKGEHIHYCITTAPDRSAYKPFESVPFAFRNYQQATDAAGTKWKNVAWGRPTRGTIIRRPKSANGGMAKTKLLAFKDLLNFGTLSGTISLPPGVTLAGKLTVTAMTAWGEPVTSRTINAANSAGPFTYKINGVPNYQDMKVSVSFSGTTLPAGTKLSGTSKAVNVKANQTNTADVLMQRGTLIISPRGLYRDR